MLDELVHNLLPSRRRIRQATSSDDGLGAASVWSAIGPVQQYPLIGVVTPVRNRRHWTISFAKMLCQQDYPLFKFYVVDSQSTDGTSEALRELDFSPIVVLSAPDRAYWTEATNIGVRHALDDGCKYILTINDDAIIPDHYLTTLVGSAMKGGALVCGSVISYANTPGRLWGVGAHNNWSSGSFLQLSLANIWDDAVADTAVEADALLPVDYLCGNGTLIHRSIFEIVGLYDAKHTPHYHADSEFTMRVERAGIPRWIAARARLFNRFSEVADGSFAARNQKLFSLRSANYAPALIYILDEYCPQEFKATGLVRYCMSRLHQNHWRQWSRMLRLVDFLVKPASERTVSCKQFFPPTDEILCLAADINILMSLPNRELAVMLYAFFLRRAGSDEEIAGILKALAGGASGETLARGFIDSTEFALRPGVRRDYIAALLQLRTRPGAAVHFGAVSPDEQRVLAFLARNGRMPTRTEAVADERGKLPLQAVSEAPLSAQSGKILVFMSVDVLCMAVADPKAATGVHRYVLNVLNELMNHRAVDLRIFHAPELASQAVQLQAPGGHLANAAFAPNGVRQVEGVVFYPYFPLNRKDARFSGLSEIFTIHDLFPLTNPEWFSAVAVSNFRRQLHDLVDTCHLLCDSAATEAQVSTVLPGGRWTTSVAHPGVRRPVGFGDKGPSLPTGLIRMISRGFVTDPYFLCVGTIEPRKNLTMVIRALAQLQHPKVDRLQMLVVGQEGWNISSDELNALAGGSRNRIQFLGRVSEQKLWSLYQNAICTVFPSRAEGFGFPIVESMSCGTPVVTTDGSSMREIAQTGAILVDPMDPAAIAAAIDAIATDPELRKRLSREAIQQAGLYTWNGCADLLVREFARLATKRDSADPTPMAVAV